MLHYYCYQGKIISIRTITLNINGKRNELSSVIIGHLWKSEKIFSPSPVRDDLISVESCTFRRRSPPTKHHISPKKELNHVARWLQLKVKQDMEIHSREVCGIKNGQNQLVNYNGLVIKEFY